GYELAGNKLSGDGFATYRLTVKTKKGYNDKAVRFMNLSSATRIWLNDKPVFSSGRVGRNAKDHIPSFSNGFFHFSGELDEFQLIVQVSKFSHYEGGLWSEIILGNEEQISGIRDRLLITDLLLFGILGALGLYHFVIFSLRRKDLTALYFGLFCLSISFNLATQREKVLYNFFSERLNPFEMTANQQTMMRAPSNGNSNFSNGPSHEFQNFAPERNNENETSKQEMSTYKYFLFWILNLKIEYISFFFSAFFLMRFFYSMYPDEIGKWVPHILLSFAIILSAIVLFSSGKFFPVIQPYFMIIVVATQSFGLYALCLAVSRKRTGARLSLLGSSILIASFAIDNLGIKITAGSQGTALFGLLAFSFCQLIILARRFSLGFLLSEKLSEDLEKQNIRLTQMDKIKDEFLSNTSHELRTPLNGIIGIAESLVDGAAGKLTPDTAKNLSLIVKSGRRLSSLINDILDFSKLKNSELHIQNKPVDLKSLCDIALNLSSTLIKGK
ncbi:MAG: hypothetical protein K8R21_16175, partial [Leptospira sp.]|nr:hypothetical protein [Leptospira sp.]